MGDVKPEIVCQYPYFNRQVDKDETVLENICNYAYQRDYKLKVLGRRPDDESQSAWFANNNEKFAYTELYTFYEDLNDYKLAYLQH